MLSFWEPNIALAPLIFDIERKQVATKAKFLRLLVLKDLLAK